MPYINPSDRAELDSAIDQLAEKIAARAKHANYDAAFAGLLNYSCTRLSLAVTKSLFGLKMRYWLVATVTGVFKNVSDEFYRRLGTPYEDKQIKVSGDVDLYEEFTHEINKP